MSDSVQKKISVVGLAALFMTTFAYMSDLVLVPAADIMYGYWLEQGVEMSVLDFILSGSQLFAIISALLSPLFMRHFSKKGIVVVLYAVFTVVTIAPIFNVDPVFIAVTRAVAGFCFGALFPTGVALIIELYRDDEERSNRYVGFYNGAMAILGTIITIVSGLLIGAFVANGPIEGIRAAMYENIFNVVILVLLVICLPRTPAEKHVDYGQHDGGNQALRGFPVAKTVALVASIAMANIIYCTFAYQYAMYLGQSFPEFNPSVIAILGSLEAFGGFIAGLLFGIVFKRTRRYTITLAFALFGVAMMIFGFMSTVLVAVIVGLLLNGIAFGLSVPYYYSYTAAFYEPRHNSLLTGFLTMGMGIGIFLCTFTTTFFTDILGLVSFDEASGMPVTEWASYFIYIGGIAFLGAIVSLALAIKDSRSGVKLDDPT
jgi:MFS family permease